MEGLQPSQTPPITYLYRAQQLVRFRFCRLGGGCRCIESFGDEPEGERQLPGELGEAGDGWPNGVLPQEAEQHGGRGREDQWTSDQPQHRDEPGHKARPVHQVRHQHRVRPAREAGPDQEGPVMNCNESPADRDQRGLVRAGDARLPQRHHRQEADDADDNDRGFQGAQADVTKGDAFILPPDDRKQRDGSTDDGKGEDHLKERAQEHAGVWTGADDIAGAVEHRTVQDERTDRGDVGDEVEHTRRYRDPSRWYADNGCSWPGGMHVFVSFNYCGLLDRTHAFVGSHRFSP
jgi:hypothetical protein